MYRPCWHSGCTFNCNKSTSLKKKKKSSRFWKNSHKRYTIRPEGDQMETLLLSRAARNISESRRRVGALRKPQGSRPQPKIFKRGVESWEGIWMKRTRSKLQTCQSLDEITGRRWRPHMLGHATLHPRSSLTLASKSCSSRYPGGRNKDKWVD